MDEHADAGQALHERLKEITCLYEIRRGMGLELSVDNVCQQIFEHLIPAMQFPEIATAMIELDGRRFTSENQARASRTNCNRRLTPTTNSCGQLRVILSRRQAIPGAGRAAAHRRGRK